ncbi:Putative heterokaryon incompatibility [Colletotrichum destructivum]|uniref:Heterokaryon incompatibility n=1 Tax=Colletotrichum destructivum TaxID=34406 RepID=A0AAX4J340_9PEZI|nr:Putative heterokaryon incompatibility [Colletotrichum destructivum]
MTTKIVPISLEEALKNGLRPGNMTNPKSFDFFDMLGTAGCQLDCADYALRQKLSPDTIKQSKASHEEIIRRGKHRAVQGKAFTYEGLEKSAFNGCGSCGTLKAILDAVPSHHYGKLLPSTIVRWTVRHSGTLELAAPDGNEYYLWLLNLAGSVNIFRRFQPTNGLVGDTASPISFQRVQNWLNDCETGHEKCGKGTNTKLPTRLVDVVQPGDRAGVRLVETTAGQTGTYVCLSHCWGKIRIKSMTQRENLKRRLNLIPWCLLPPSFQQAIEITRKLGILYLWIDSLCIIQDDKGDWEKEAAQMVNVYCNSYATIAVSWSHSSQGGCYSRTIPSSFFKITNADEDDFTIGLGIGAKRDNMSEYDRVQAYLPLFNRAWCLQERLLSRRIIHCNYGEMAFDCGNGYSCECGGKQHYSWHNVIDLSGTYTPLRSRSKYLALLKNHTTASSTAIVTKDGKIDPYERWHRVVSEYTCLNLTKTSDMLPALSGLAHETAELLYDEFLAGLWSKNIEQDLMWRVVTVADWRHQRENILKRGWIAPSWSWASTGSGCKVGFPVFHGAEVLDYKTPGIAKSAKVTCPPGGADPFGPVSYGLLRVTAKRLPILIQRPCSRWDVKRRWTNRVYGRFLLYAREDQREWQNCVPATGEEPLEFGPAKSELWVDPSIERMDRCFIRNDDPAARRGPCRHCIFLPAELLYVKGLKTDKGALSTRTRDFFLAVARDATSSYIRVGMLEVICGSRDERNTWFERVWEALVVPEASITIF